MIAPIAEKTLAHPTDAICWEDVPAGACELEYRPPSAFELTRTPIELGMQLTKTCLVVNGLTWLIYWVLLPHFGWDTNPIGLTAVVTGCLLASLVLFANPSMSIKRKWPTLRIALLMPAALVVGSRIYHGFGYNVTGVGCLLYCVVAIPFVLRLCKELNRHTTFWHTADFCLLYTSPSPRDATLSRMPSSA